ncbi:MAG: hypothetical protein B7Y80_01695 [Hyphomicrobium sp. 32-62-53]|nr:MAG: hypothetical protein B7Z29_02045 [Hyphomicrobium sp. 12-62-95]OYY01468.1 MAG: hypothetical protein B7Y80_01695 [Hyphomicrobium sp. 32-62-53]
MTTLNLAGFWLVTDNGRATVVRDVVGQIVLGSSLHVMVRHPSTRICEMIEVDGWGGDLFAPEDKSAADGHAAALVAADSDAVETETGEAA